MNVQLAGEVAMYRELEEEAEEGEEAVVEEAVAKEAVVKEAAEEEAAGTGKAAEAAAYPHMKRHRACKS